MAVYEVMSESRVQLSLKHDNECISSPTAAADRWEQRVLPRCIVYSANIDERQLQTMIPDFLISSRSQSPSAGDVPGSAAHSSRGHLVIFLVCKALTQRF